MPGSDTHSEGPRDRQGAGGSPTFVIGCGRSGTTLVYDLLASTWQFSFITNYSDRFPALAGVGRLASATATPSPRRSQRLLIRPVEGHRTWTRVFADVSGEAGVADLPSISVDLAERAVRTHERWFGGRSFVNKNTANTRRVGALDAIFPGSRWIHVVRDPRAVALSLSRVSFWPEMRMWWRGGQTVSEVLRSGTPSLVLGAECWQAEVSAARSALGQVESERQLTVVYEDLVRRPSEVLEALETWLRLGSGSIVGQRARRTFHDATARAIESLSAQDRAAIIDVAGINVDVYGYSG